MHFSLLLLWVGGFVSALKDELEQFIAIETKKLQDANAEEAIERVRKKQVSVESLAKQWTNLFSKVFGH